MSKVLRTGTLPDCEPEIGRWLWALEEVRRRTVGLVGDLDQATVDWRGPDEEENSIGSLLYHIALIEMDWLFGDILQQDVPAPIADDFPLDARDAAGRLAHLPSVPVAEHLGRLNRSRETFLRTCRGLSLESWERLRSPPNEDYLVTPAWVVFHLVEHEAGHAFQIGALRARAKRFFPGTDAQT